MFSYGASACGAVCANDFPAITRLAANYKATVPPESFLEFESVNADMENITAALEVGKTLLKAFMKPLVSNFA